MLVFQGGKTFCATFCASLIAGSRREFSVCWLLEFRVKFRCKRLLPVKHFYLTWHVCCFFRRLKITLDSEQPMLKEKQIIPSVWGGIKRFEHFQTGLYFSDNYSICELILCPVLRLLSPGWIKTCLYSVISSYGYFFTWPDLFTFAEPALSLSSVEP